MKEKLSTELAYIHPLVGEFEFKDLGRNKVSTRMKINGEQSLYRAVSPYLMSRDIGYEYDAETKEGSIFAGFRTVGTFRRVIE